MTTYTLSAQSLTSLKKACTAAGLIGVEAAVLTEGMIRGVNPAENAALITEIDTNLPPDVRIGIGRINELNKRLALLGDAATVDLVANEAGDVTSLTISAGRSKASFRCSKATLIKYPKENIDPPGAIISMGKEEAQLLVRAIKTYGPEEVSLHLAEDGTLTFEGRDSTNDVFKLDIEKKAEFIDEPLSIVTKFDTGNLTSTVNAAASAGAVSFVLGSDINTITILVNGHGLVLVPKAD
jgi:hypothetical protein